VPACDWLLHRPSSLVGHASHLVSSSNDCLRWDGVYNGGSLRTRRSNRPSKHLQRLQDLRGGRSFPLDGAQVQARSAAPVSLTVYRQVQNASGRCSCPHLLHLSTPFISSIPFLLLHINIHIHITSQPSLHKQNKHYLTQTSTSTPTVPPTTRPNQLNPTNSTSEDVRRRPQGCFGQSVTARHRLSCSDC